MKLIMDLKIQICVIKKILASPLRRRKLTIPIIQMWIILDKYFYLLGGIRIIRNLLNFLTSNETDYICIWGSRFDNKAEKKILASPPATKEINNSNCTWLKSLCEQIRVKTKILIPLSLSICEEGGRVNIEENRADLAWFTGPVCLDANDRVKVSPPR